MMRHETHAHEDDVVVFNIGMTIQQKHRIDLWWPVFTAMPAMIAELSRYRAAAERGEAEDLGFLGAYTLMGSGGPWVVQYWRGTEQLYRYAASADARHLPAWKRFNATARKHPEAVGIWHETFAVPASGIETLYGNAAHRARRPHRHHRGDPARTGRPRAPWLPGRLRVTPPGHRPPPARPR